MDNEIYKQAVGWEESSEVVQLRKEASNGND